MPKRTPGRWWGLITVTLGDTLDRCALTPSELDAKS
jgi:hypothetical protein